ncbi:hypothetical protein ACSVH2_01845 [Flavobacterium sp. RSB2_4_14]|uniref:hypothetical protein n=1 Tax=Flavobacterium sp. RSB2_4_14 TaxID=3447665 RepID=UPI003F39F0C2
MNANVKIEEIAPYGDFVLTSYTRDFDAIKANFPKMDAAFRDGFIAKLDFVKELESSLVLTESQKGVTESLYAEAKRLNSDLNFLSAYFADASLNTAIVTGLKNDLLNRNIEGAILKIEGVKQFVVSNQAVLVEQGMNTNFPDVLTDYKVSLTQKNNEQNELINNRKQLTDANQVHYDELLKMIKKIVRNGKLVFKGTVTQDEYTSVKVIQRMRATKKKAEGGVK